MKYLDRIRQLRKAKGLTQLDMSEKIGMAKNNYGKIENGHIDLSVKRLYEIANILEVDVSTLLGESGADPEKSLKLEKENFILRNKNEQLDKQVNAFAASVQFMIDLFTSKLQKKDTTEVEISEENKAAAEAFRARFQQMRFNLDKDSSETD